MPISVQSDLKKRYNLSGDFSLKKGIGLSEGSVLDHVRGAIADQNWDDFIGSFRFAEANKSLLYAIAKKYNLGSKTEVFESFWDLAKAARNYAKDAASEISSDVEDAYKHLARIAALAESSADNCPTFKRIKGVTWDKIVIFSDLHMTAVQGLDYFKKANLELYCQVLDHYLENGYSLVENGDIEDCLMHDFTNSAAAAWAEQAKHASFPIEFSDVDWEDFLKTRYNIRLKALASNFAAFERYYEIVQTFVTKARYARLTGNHDTYLDDGNEALLQQAIEAKIGTEVYDVLRIFRYYEPTNQNLLRYVILHGHQFDPECCQHGSVPHARSLGEVNSELLSWAFQGPDRIFALRDSLCWINGCKTYPNVLARKEPKEYPGDAGADLALGAKADIKSNCKAWAEELLGNEIAWEYFENDDKFEALMLEMWTGDEFVKMRHLNEQDLCAQYKLQFQLLNTGAPLPKLVIGHTHEPRQNAYDASTKSNIDYYLNSGSAGRYENLLWCIEIEGNEDQICSWSLINGQPVRSVWRSEGKELIQSS